MDADPLDVEEGLDELVELGLLEFIGRRRYRLHDLLRLFSSHELRREGEQYGWPAQTRLRNWLLSTVAAAASRFDPDAPPSGPEGPEWLAHRAGANEWIRWNNEWIRWNVEQWWPAFREAAQLGNTHEVLKVAEALRWYSPTWMAWNSWQKFYSVSVAAARRNGDKASESTHLSYLAWAELLEQDDAHAGLQRAQEQSAQRRRPATTSPSAGDPLQRMGARQSERIRGRSHGVERVSRDIRPNCRCRGRHTGAEHRGDHLSEGQPVVDPSRKDPPATGSGDASCED